MKRLTQNSGAILKRKALNFLELMTKVKSILNKIKQIFKK